MIKKFFLLISIILFTSCSNNNNNCKSQSVDSNNKTVSTINENKPIKITDGEKKEIEESYEYKKLVMEGLSDEDKNILENCIETKDKGVYHYITYTMDTNELIDDTIYGVDENYEFSIKSDGYSSLTDGKTATFVDTNKNLYYQSEVTGQESQYTKEIKALSGYYEIYGQELKEIIHDDNYITLIYKNGCYDKYDKKNFDLVESIFYGQEYKLVQKLEDKQDDVKASYDKYIKVIDGMKKASTVGEVTGNE